MSQIENHSCQMLSDEIKQIELEFSIDEMSASMFGEAFNHLKNLEKISFIDFQSIDFFLQLKLQNCNQIPITEKKNLEKRLSQLNLLKNNQQSEEDFSTFLDNSNLSDKNFKQPITFKEKKTSRKYPSSHSMNNMPGFLISAIHSIIVHLRYKQIFQQNQISIIQVSNCFYRLIDVIKHIRTKVGSRKQLRMAFNDFDIIDRMELQESKKLSKSEQKYIDIIKTFPVQILNEAKRTLRTLLSQRMTFEWIHESASIRKFTDQSKKTTFEKYLTYFRRQLQSGYIGELVSRKQVIEIEVPSFQQGKEETLREQKRFHFTSHVCDEEVKSSGTQRFEGCSENVELKKEKVKKGFINE